MFFYNLEIWNIFLPYLLNITAKIRNKDIWRALSGLESWVLSSIEFLSNVKGIGAFYNFFGGKQRYVSGIFTEFESEWERSVFLTCASACVLVHFSVCHLNLAVVRSFLAVFRFRENSKCSPPKRPRFH